MNCDRCLMLSDFVIYIKRQVGDKEPYLELWCWSCVSGDYGEEE